MTAILDVRRLTKSFVKGDNRMEVIVVGGSVRDLKGALPKPRKPLTLEEMDRAIAKGARRAGR